MDKSFFLIFFTENFSVTVPHEFLFCKKCIPCKMLAIFRFCMSHKAKQKKNYRLRVLYPPPPLGLFRVYPSGKIFCPGQIWIFALGTPSGNTPKQSEGGRIKYTKTVKKRIPNWRGSGVARFFSAQHFQMA